MCPHVIPKVYHLCGTVRAVTTCIRLFPSVSPHVSLQASLLSGTVRTERARERFFSGMSSQVADIISPGRGRVRAVWTLVKLARGRRRRRKTLAVH